LRAEHFRAAPAVNHQAVRVQKRAEVHVTDVGDGHGLTDLLIVAR
jgi:hypothetical protein